MSLKNHRMFSTSFTRKLMSNLANMGVSDAAVAANDSEHSANTSRELDAAEKALRKLSNAELHDLGISRGEISHVVRHGRPGIDPEPADPTGRHAA